MAKRRVMFVDDEANILDGLRRMLRSERKQFEMHFAESGAMALEKMDELSFDIIVSDMRMPGIDGAQLLAEVRKRSPITIRIVLTGQADDDSLMRTVGVAHQVLAKPSDSDQLREVLKKSSALLDMMEDNKLRELISSIDTLPSLPSVYERLQEKLKDPDVVLSDIGKVISSDLAMTAKVLQIVNSAFFGLFQKVDSPERAVSLLGLDTIKALVLGVHIFEEMPGRANRTFIDSLWKHSMAIGVLAKKIAASITEEEDFLADAFLAGILHDIGKLLMLANLQAEYEQALKIAREEKEQLSVAEQRIFQTSHSEVGAYLIGLWGFKSSIIDAVAFHHQLENYPVGKFSPALAVHVADIIYYGYHPDTATGGLHTLNEEYIEHVGLTANIDEWREICQEQLETMEIEQSNEEMNGVGDGT